MPPKYSPQVAVDVPVMPPPPIFSPPLMSPPAPLGEMAPMPIPHQWMMGMTMQPPQAFPAAGVGAPMLPLPELVATQPQQGQGIVIPALLPKASSSAGMVELAIGMTNQMNGLHNMLAMLAYQTMYRPQVVPQPTPPPRVCIPNCVENSQ